MFNCFSMAALRTADGAYLLGEMGSTTVNAGRIYFPAGTPEPDDVVGGKVDLAGNVIRELAEETGLTTRDLEIAEGWTCVRIGPRLAMMKEMRSRETAHDLRARILTHLPHDPHQELSDIHIVRGPADVDKTLTIAQCLARHGYTWWTSYQPASRFWPFQWIESGWLLALSVLLIAATVWLVRRRAT